MFRRRLHPDGRSAWRGAKSATIFAILCSAVLIFLGSLYSQASSPKSQGSPDFDGNGTVGFSDFVLLAEAFGSVKGDAGYGERFDLDGNGVVGFPDFVIFAGRFGEKIPVSSGDREALVALYNATDGPNWEENTNWMTDKDLSTWYGVGVVNGRVTYLNLYDNNLLGTIPKELAQLTNLRELHLSTNHLMGPVPSELGQLTNLDALSLDGNDLSGPVPPELGQLTNLLELRLQRNKLTETIPPKLGQLTNLGYLDLSFNKLNGPIPTELGQLTNLEYLNLSVNSFDDQIPSQMGKLARLKSLKFWVSGLIGEIPRELGQLAALETLDLSWNNDLTGPIPRELGQLSNLKVLELDVNDLTGPIPAELGRLTNLETLDLGHNDLTGEIPSELGRLNSLTEMRLNENDLIRPIPKELVQLMNLQELWLSSNELTGTIPAELGQLTSLTELLLSANNLSGSIPRELGQLVNLQILYLDWNDLTGTIPSEMGQLTNLSILYLYENAGLTGQLPESFTGLNLREFELQGTQVCIPATAEFREWLERIPDKTVTTECVYPEREALVALYNGTNGPNWKNRTNWLGTPTLGEWYGVTTDADERVIRLDLHGNNLRGTIPHQLGQLTHLKTLKLSSNADLSGPLPNGLTGLALDSLALDGARLCAPPHAEFQKWLTRIPSRTEIDRCSETRADYYALVELYNGTDGLNWTNAANWASNAPLGDWYGVTTDAAGRVTRLDLYKNNLSGTIPRHLGQLTSLRYLRLSGNQLKGVIPPSLGQLTDLTSLSLADNQLSGRIPSELGQLANLENLYLVINRLTGEIPAELGKLTKLTSLQLSSNRLSGDIPSVLGQLTNLQSLSLGDNKLTGEIPLALGQLAGLHVLALSENNLTGEIPSGLGQLNMLKQVYLADNILTGEIPSELGQLTTLRQMHLSNNQLSGDIPSELGSLNDLRDLILYSNRLTGEIPSELGRLNKLSLLLLGENQLTGEIPAELGRLGSLRTLSLPQNTLNHRIPPELGRLSNLEKLDLSTNRLSGEIPAELGQLAKLERMDLSVNQLSGEIPAELGDLGRLQSLNLSINGALSGSLPHTLTHLNLETLVLKETLLCAPEETEFQAWLGSIPGSRVPNCTRIDASTAYLTQATQSLEYPVPLVAGEDALLRVFVTAPPDADAAMPPVRATFFLDEAEVHTAEIEGQATGIPWQVNQASLLNSANAVVPASVVMPGLEMVVEIDPDRTIAPDLGIGVRLPATGRTAIDVRPVPPFELTLVPFLWSEKPDSTVLTETEHFTSESDLFRLTRDVLPVNDFHLTVHKPVLTSVDPTSDSADTLLPETELIYTIEGAQGFYMGIFRKEGKGGLRGIAKLSENVSLSILDGNVIAHELGHNLSLLHAPGCGARFSDPDFPTDDGTTGGWGYDFLNATLVNPETSDLMTYCRPQWISEFSFSKALNHRYHERGRIEAAAYSASDRGLLLWGGLYGDKDLFLEPVFVVNAPPSLPRMDGPYRLTGDAEDGSNVFDVAFGMAEIACGGSGGSFAFILPVEPDWPGRLSRITFSGPEGVSILDGEEGPVAALLLDRATGKCPRHPAGLGGAGRKARRHYARDTGTGPGGSRQPRHS